jgi:hypothetical protein
MIPGMGYKSLGIIEGTVGKYGFGLQPGLLAGSHSIRRNAQYVEGYELTNPAMTNVIEKLKKAFKEFDKELIRESRVGWGRDALNKVASGDRIVNFDNIAQLWQSLKGRTVRVDPILLQMFGVFYKDRTPPAINITTIQDIFGNNVSFFPAGKAYDNMVGLSGGHFLSPRSSDPIGARSIETFWLTPKGFLKFIVLLYQKSPAAAQLFVQMYLKKTDNTTKLSIAQKVARFYAMGERQLLREALESKNSNPAMTGRKSAVTELGPVTVNGSDNNLFHLGEIEDQLMVYMTSSKSYLSRSRPDPMINQLSDALPVFLGSATEYLQGHFNGLPATEVLDRMLKSGDSLPRLAVMDKRGMMQLFENLRIEYRQSLIRQNAKVSQNPARGRVNLNTRNSAMAANEAEDAYKKALIDYDIAYQSFGNTKGGNRRVADALRHVAVTRQELAKALQAEGFSPAEAAIYMTGMVEEYLTQASARANELAHVKTISPIQTGTEAALPRAVESSVVTSHLYTIRQPGLPRDDSSPAMITKNNLTDTLSWSRITIAQRPGSIESYVLEARDQFVFALRSTISADDLRLAIGVFLQKLERRHWLDLAQDWGIYIPTLMDQFSKDRDIGSVDWLKRFYAAVDALPRVEHLPTIQKPHFPAMEALQDNILALSPKPDQRQLADLAMLTIEAIDDILQHDQLKNAQEGTAAGNLRNQLLVARAKLVSFSRIPYTSGIFGGAAVMVASILIILAMDSRKPMETIAIAGEVYAGLLSIFGISKVIETVGMGRQKKQIEGMIAKMKAEQEIQPDLAKKLEDLLASYVGASAGLRTPMTHIKYTGYVMSDEKDFLADKRMPKNFRVPKKFSLDWEGQSIAAQFVSLGQGNETKTEGEIPGNVYKIVSINGETPKTDKLLSIALFFSSGTKGGNISWQIDPDSLTEALDAAMRTYTVSTSSGTILFKKGNRGKRDRILVSDGTDFPDILNDDFKKFLLKAKGNIVFSRMTVLDMDTWFTNQIILTYPNSILVPYVLERKNEDKSRGLSYIQIFVDLLAKDENFRRRVLSSGFSDYSWPDFVSDVLSRAGIDAAMKTSTGLSNLTITKPVLPKPTEGGIDLNTSNGMQWKVSKDGQGVEMNVDPAMIARIQREGIDSLSPVIFKITPVASIWPLVGLPAPVK